MGFIVLVAVWFLSLVPAPSTRAGRLGDRKLKAMVFRSYIRTNIHYSWHNINHLSHLNCQIHHVQNRTFAVYFDE